MLYELDYYVRKMMDSKKRVFIVTTGAGAGLQKRLWEVPGASSFFVGSAFPYAREAQDEFLGYLPERLVNPGVALDYAIAAYLKADNGDPDAEPIGLGLTAVAASTEAHKGDHRVHAAVVSRTAVYVSDVILPKEIGADARKRDGLVADTIGFELLLMACGILEPAFVDSYRNQTEGKCLREASQEARDRFMERPLVTRYGRRLPAPEGNIRLFPGAFNPPHEGHFANAGVDTIFQISASPPHKPALTLQDMLGRIYHFRHKRDVMFNDGYGLYIEKARRFPNSTIVMGTDALRRMLDPSWGIEINALLGEFEALGIRFEVSPRDDDSLDQVPIPGRYQALFKALPHSPYSHLSSTKIRNGKR